MNVGFTGSRRPTVRSLQLLFQVVADLPEDTHVITGGCVGIDAWAARLARLRSLPVLTILPARSGPYVDPDWRRWCDAYFELSGSENPTRDRNQAIVDRSQRLEAFPEFPETAYGSRRSGTWMTVRMARRADLPCQIWLPDAPDPRLGDTWIPPQGDARSRKR